MNELIIGICGIGFVGNAMMQSFINKNYVLNKNLYVYDKYKDGGLGDINDLLKTDILFLSLPTTFDYNTRSYDKSALYETIEFLDKESYNGTIVIKSTVEPMTCNNLADKYKLNIVHNPEFLTARTAYNDFHYQKHIVIGKTNICNDKSYENVFNFYKTNYPDAQISQCTSTESETMKLFLNTFYASKVQIFTEFYLLCEKIGLSYDNVKGLMLRNDWINPMHTNIPGPDGQISYGGLCFPKDTNALLHYMEINNVPHDVLKAVIKERENMRDDHFNTNKDNKN